MSPKVTITATIGAIVIAALVACYLAHPIANPSEGYKFLFGVRSFLLVSSG